MQKHEETLTLGSGNGIQMNDLKTHESDLIFLDAHGDSSLQKTIVELAKKLECRNDDFLHIDFSSTANSNG